MTGETADHEPGDLAEPPDSSGSAANHQPRAHDAIDRQLRQADADYVAGNTMSGEELRTRYGLSSATPPHRRFGQLPDVVVPENFDDPLPDPESTAQEGNSTT